MDLGSSDAPVTMTKMLSSSKIQKGKMVHLECELSTESQSVTWLKDNREMEDGVKYQMVAEGKSHVLLIKDFQSTDQGVYSCVASEEAKTSINLNLEGTLLGLTSHLTYYCCFLSTSYVEIIICVFLGHSVWNFATSWFTSLRDYSLLIYFSCLFPTSSGYCYMTRS